MSLKGQSFSVSKLNMITTDILLIDVTSHDKEIKERKSISANTFLNN